MILGPALPDRRSGILHGFFSAEGGVSEGLYASRNCGFGSADARENVAANRARCLADLAPRAGAVLVTAYQVHSPTALRVTEPWEPGAAPQADALVTDRPGLALGILTADCAPVLFADAEAGVIGAAHAGWKGALGGVLEATVQEMLALGARAERISAAVGPHIAQGSYEVGPEFRDRFLAADPANDHFFAPSDRPGHARFALGAYVGARLAGLGLGQVSVDANDTAAADLRFFSYRRACLAGEPDYGRGLSAIVLT